MNQAKLESLLSPLSLGGVRYFDRLGSTNDEAGRWAEQGAPDLALVIADEQTAGRGRAGRQWYTPAGAALAFSLVLFPTLEDSYSLQRMTALGALAVCDALRNRYSLPAQIKWPNDILLNGKKVGGVLPEAQWNGGRLASVILGIGINVAPASVSEAEQHEAELRFPATCVEETLGRAVDRWDLLQAVLSEFLRWRPRLSAPDFMRAWESNLAFRGEWVQVFAGESRGKDGLPRAIDKLPPPLQEGQVIGLAPDGSLKLRVMSGDVVTLQFGEVRLRPTTKS
jgi:BirA family biotin operon repressor/biotin-[acetyl-CoA-carboxylase] ligase